MITCIDEYYNEEDEMYELTFNEAVEYLVENYECSIEEAVGLIYDNISEANADDLKRAIHKGERIGDQKVGMLISGKGLADRGSTPSRFDPFGQAKLANGGSEKLRQEFGKKNMWYATHFNRKPTEEEKKSFPDKERINDMAGTINSTKDKTDKEKVRDATRTVDSIVPDHGANPKYSKDADPKAVKAYMQAYSKNPYKKYDIDETIKSMGLDEKDAKARIIRDRMERGVKLPKSVTDKLVEKKDLKPALRGDVKSKKFERYKERKSFYEDPDHKDFDKLEDDFVTMRTTTDPALYHQKRVAISKKMGIDTKQPPMYPQLKKVKKGYVVSSTLPPRKEQERSKRDQKKNYYHTSVYNDIKKLYPTPRSEEGIDYPEARVFASKDTPTGKGGFPLNDKLLDLYNLKTYKLKLDNGQKVMKDNMAAIPFKASYIKASKAIPVEKVESKKK